MKVNEPARLKMFDLLYKNPAGDAGHKK